MVDAVEDRQALPDAAKKVVNAQRNMTTEAGKRTAATDTIDSCL